MSHWDDMADDEFDEALKYLLSQRQDIKDPITDLDIADIVEEWQGNGCGFIDVEAERFHLGEDEDGYIILAHLTPSDNNPAQSHFFLLRDLDYKRKHKMKYKVDFISSFEYEEDLDPFCDTIGLTNNLYDAVFKMAIYWKSYIR